MKSITWDDAFLIFGKWRSEETSVGFMKLSSVDIQNGTARLDRSATIRVLACSQQQGTITLELHGTPTRCGFYGATFRYADERDSPFMDGQAKSHPCTLEVTFPGGQIWIFDEMLPGR